MKGPESIRKKMKLGDIFELELKAPIYSGVKFGPMNYDENLVEIIEEDMKFNKGELPIYVFKIRPLRKGELFLKFGVPSIQYDVSLDVE